MSRIRTRAGYLFWAAFIGLAGFAQPATAAIFVEANVFTCGNASLTSCSLLSSDPLDIKSNQIRSFGSISVGGANSTFGFGNAQIDWFHDRFGLFARGSTNTTASDGAVHMGGGQAIGEFIDQLTVQAQPGLPLGSPGLLLLPYQLHGAVHIDAPDFETAWVRINWQYGSTLGGGFGTGSLTMAYATSWDRSLMTTDDLFAVINQNVTLQIPFVVGESETFGEFVNLTALAGGIGGPGALVGFAEGDFLHTATMGGAIVLDQFGNAVADPTVISDSGFDYVHPGAVGPGPNVPEPDGFLLAAAGFPGLLIGLRRRARGK